MCVSFFHLFLSSILSFSPFSLSLLLRAYTRMGNVYFKQSKWNDAIKYYDKALAEHRSPDVMTKKSQVRHMYILHLQ